MAEAAANLSLGVSSLPFIASLDRLPITFHHVRTYDSHDFRLSTSLPPGAIGGGTCDHYCTSCRKLASILLDNAANICTCIMQTSCPTCESVLQFFSLNLTETILLCVNSSCIFPLDQDPASVLDYVAVEIPPSTEGVYRKPEIGVVRAGKTKAHNVNIRPAKLLGRRPIPSRQYHAVDVKLH